MVYFIYVIASDSRASSYNARKRRGRLLEAVRTESAYICLQKARLCLANNVYLAVIVCNQALSTDKGSPSGAGSLIRPGSLRAKI